MRTVLRSGLLALLLAVLVTPSVFAAWEAPYVEETIERGVAAARGVKDLTSFGASSDGMCLIGGFMGTGGVISWKFKLKEGKEYIFIGAGDSDVKVLNLEAWEGDKKIAQDKSQDNVPVVTITAEGDAEVLLKMKLARAKVDKDEVCFTAMLILDNTGTGAKLSQLEKCAKQLNDVCAKINDKGKLEFDKDPNSVCLAAALIGNGASRSFYRSFADDSKYLLVGAADDACKVFNLELYHEQKLVCKDDSKDANPVVSVTVEEKARCTTKMIMRESTKPSFAVVGILTPKE